jgi:hypothetical protein
MTDEDESTDPGMIGAERAILKFLRVREANEAIASHEDRGRFNVNQLAQHHLASASPTIYLTKPKPTLKSYSAARHVLHCHLLKWEKANVDNDEQQLPVHRKQGLWPG